MYVGDWYRITDNLGTTVAGKMFHRYRGAYRVWDGLRTHTVLQTSVVKAVRLTPDEIARIREAAQQPPVLNTEDDL